jgi:hypothetical protein
MNLARKSGYSMPARFRFEDGRGILTRRGGLACSDSTGLNYFFTRFPVQTSAPRRAPLVDALLDGLDFVEERLREALGDQTSQFAAVTEAGCAMPFLRDRLREDEVKWANFVLVLGTRIEHGYWREQWDELARMKSEAFAAAVEDMLERLHVLREILEKDCNTTQTRDG